MNAIYREIANMEKALENLIKLSNQPDIYNTEIGRVIEKTQRSLGINIQEIKENTHFYGA